MYDPINLSERFAPEDDLLDARRRGSIRFHLSIREDRWELTYLPSNFPLLAAAFGALVLWFVISKLPVYTRACDQVAAIYAGLLIFSTLLGRGRSVILDRSDKMIMIDTHGLWGTRLFMRSRQYPLSVGAIMITHTLLPVIFRYGLTISTIQGKPIKLVPQKMTLNQALAIAQHLKAFMGPGVELVGGSVVSRPWNETQHDPDRKFLEY
jgi:hypothetical protein